MNDCKSICLNTLDSKNELDLKELGFELYKTLMQVNGLAAKEIIRKYAKKNPLLIFSFRGYVNRVP